MTRTPDTPATGYLRAKAEKLRGEARKAAGGEHDGHADRCAYAARQMDVAADEIDHGFHLEDTAP